MLTWLLIGALTMIGGAWVAYRAGKIRGVRSTAQLSAPSSTPLLERTVRDVRVNDIVQHSGRDWLVEGTVTYDEDGHTWRGARLIDGTEERWLMVGLERTGGTTVRLLVPLALDLSGYPPDVLAHDGTSFTMGQRGTANAELTGNLGSLPGWKGSSTRCRWWRYQAAGPRALIVEKWGETYRVLWGEIVSIESIELLAGS